MDVDDMIRQLEGHRGSLFHDNVEHLLSYFGFNFIGSRYDTKVSGCKNASFPDASNLVEYIAKNKVDSISRNDLFSKKEQGNLIVLASTVYNSPDAFRSDKYDLGYLRSKHKFGLANRVITPEDARKRFGDKKPVSSALEMGFIIKYNRLYFFHPSLLYGLIKNKKEIT